jgi:molybdate transport system substrate-binding protein
MIDFLTAQPIRKQACRMACAVLATLGLAGFSGIANAAEVRAFVTIALQSVFEEIAPEFERSTGHKLNVTFGLSSALVKRIQDGEAADCLVATQGVIDGLVNSGKVPTGFGQALAKSSVGVAVRKGEPKPDLSSVDAFLKALVAARAISYSDPSAGGASGVHFSKMLDKHGLSEAMKSKTRFPPAGGLAGRLLVSGEADIAVQQVSELVSVSGVELVGLLPGELQSVTVFASGVLGSAKEPEAAKALARYLQTPAVIAVMKARGLDPN